MASNNSLGGSRASLGGYRLALSEWSRNRLPEPNFHETFTRTERSLRGTYTASSGGLRSRFRSPRRRLSASRLAFAAWLGSVARIPFVAGIDHFLPEGFGRLHPRWGSPHVALLTQTAVTLPFIVLSQAGTTVRGAYEVLISLMVVTYLIGSAIGTQVG